MKNIAKRAGVLYALAAAFIAGLVILTAQFAVNGGAWSSNRFNRHIYTRGQIASAGTITDRNGEILAKSDGGKRLYHESRAVRKATLHAVGDTEGFISTGIQSAYRQELTGYSFLNGIYTLKKYGRGSDIRLTLDANACAAAYNALDGRKGTVGVYNYKTGELLCMVSAPSYDVNNKPSAMALASQGKYEGVYLNRFLSGLYTPGSTFKVVTAAAALENIGDITTRSFVCDGKLELPSGTIICSAVHGKLNFEKAFNRSCNSAFAQIAVELGSQRLTQETVSLGFGESFSVGALATAKSRFDVSGADEAQLGWAGVGQHTTLVNPCHMLMIAGAVGNGGEGLAPYLVDTITNPSGIVTYKGSLFKEKGVSMPAETASRLSALMRSNVENYYSDSRFPGLRMCGKTGTAEVEKGKQPHAWFLGFSQRDDLPLAIVVVVENGGSGNSEAIPVAARVMKALDGGR